MEGLEKSRLFAGLAPGELDHLRSLVQQRTGTAGQTIFQEGEVGDGIYLVGEGQVQISALVGQEERRVLARIGPGDFFGEMAVLDNEPRSATAQAAGPVTLYFVRREDLLRMIESSPGLAVKLLQEFSRRTRDFNRQYVQEVLQSERLTLVGRFARSIIHDLKNPLNIIGLAADMVGMERLSPTLRESAAGRIRRQVDRLSDMIGELLEFTRSGAQDTVLPVADYAEYLKAELAEHESELAERRVQLVSEIPQGPLRVRLDAKRMMHVLSNLLNNASDAMTEGGQITVRCRADGGMVVTEVADSGRGLAPEILPRLFEAFATFGKSRGTGLGLSICKRIVEDHRGTIQAANAPSGGAVFTFTLPLVGE